MTYQEIPQEDYVTRSLLPRTRVLSPSLCMPVSPSWYDQKEKGRIESRLLLTQIFGQLISSDLKHHTSRLFCIERLKTWKPAVEVLGDA